MKRLWVRLALMISGVLFFMFFLQFLNIVLDLDHDNPPMVQGQDLDQVQEFHGGPIGADRAQIAKNLLGFAGFSLLVGTLGGILISLIITAPLKRLLHATKQIAAGDRQVQVPLQGPLELKELASNFNSMAVSLSKAELQRQHLIADISHELRTPLTVLHGSLRAALDGIYSLDESEVSRLCQQTNYLIRLVNDLRELSMAEAGKLTLNRKALDLVALGEECLEDLRPLAEDRSIILKGRWEELPSLELDSLRIRQILINLLSNAIRHSPDHGEVILGGRQASGSVEIYVEDHGQGLDPDQLRAVFDRFYRADPSRSRESGGSGLGLTIARALAEAHGGSLVAQSAGLGAGARFTLILPR